jgi:integrase
MEPASAAKGRGQRDKAAARDRFRVQENKTRERWVPIFPEVRPYLEAAYEQAPPGATHVITRYRSSEANLRTQFQRIIRRAGETPWPKLFHNLRASRETELAAEFPIHVVCAWIGNSPAIAAKHYLTVQDSDFAKATQKAAHSGAMPKEMKGNNCSVPPPKHWKNPSIPFHVL